jgi:hypothetical protein
VEIPSSAEVKCSNGVCNHALDALINLAIDKLNGWVARENEILAEFIGSIEVVTISLPDKVVLHCTGAYLKLDNQQSGSLPTYTIHRSWS